MIVIDKHLGLEIVNHLHRADGQAVSILVALIHDGKRLRKDTHLRILACAPLLVDHAALGINLLGVERQGARPVVEHEETAVGYGGALQRHITYIIYGLVDGGVGVEIISELDADTLQPVDHALAGEVLCAVETHVFKEMGKTLLVVVL